MPLWKQALLRRYHAPAGDGGSDTGGTATLDRGDDFAGTDDDDLDPENPDKGGDLKDPFKDKADDADADDKDADDKDETKADAEDKPKKKDSRIPLNRHKEILAKERSQREALERQLAQYQQGQKVAQTNEDLTKAEDSILAMEKQYNKLLADGEIDKASDLMAQIRRAEREIVETKAEMRAQAAEIRARESARYDIVLERVEEAYPQLNQDSDEYDEELVADVVDLKAVYERRGQPPSKALQAAVKKLLGSAGRDQKQATDVDPRVSEKDVQKALRDGRKKDASGKAADVNKRQPPNTRTVGMDSDKAGGGLSPKDVMGMSQEDFRKLDEKQLAKLRGDEV